MAQPTLNNKYRRRKKVGSYPYLTVIFTITLALFITGLCGLLILQANKLSAALRDNIEIHVYLDKYLTPEETAKVGTVLKSKSYLESRNDTFQLRLVPKEEAARQFMKEAGEDFVSFLGENPLRDAYVIKIKPDLYQRSEMRIIRDDVEKIPGVFEATYTENLVEDINHNIARVAYVLLLFAGLLVTAVVMLIGNTIKLAMFSQRLLIRSMQLVGATDAFIQRPFLLRAILQGLSGGAIASVLLLISLQYANSQVEGLVLLQDNLQIAGLLGLLCVLGVLIGLLSSYVNVRKYLQLSLDELY